MFSFWFTFCCCVRSTFSLWRHLHSCDVIMGIVDERPLYLCFAVNVLCHLFLADEQTSGRPFGEAALFGRPFWKESENHSKNCVAALKKGSSEKSNLIYQKLIFTISSSALILCPFVVLSFFSSFLGLENDPPRRESGWLVKQPILKQIRLYQDWPRQANVG